MQSFDWIEISCLICNRDSFMRMTNVAIDMASNDATYILYYTRIILDCKEENFQIPKGVKMLKIEIYRQKRFCWVYYKTTHCKCKGNA